MTISAATRRGAALGAFSALLLSLAAGPASAQSVAPLAAQAQIDAAAPAQAFRNALAEAAAADPAVAGFYKDRGYAPFWTSADAAGRRAALLSALSRAGAHGLPQRRYDPAELIAAFRAARTEGDRGRLEVRMSLALLDYARDVQTGALVPSSVAPGIVREVAVRDRRGNLDLFAESDPAAFLAALPPRTPEYLRLMKARLDLARAAAEGRWGAAVPAGTLEPGASGPAFLALRDRLAAMGYLPPGAAMARYDETVKKAVGAFQADHGLGVNGIAGAETIAAINVPEADRLASVIVAMERERWLNQDRGKRHIWVNLADFSAQIVDEGRVTFQTRAVVGAVSPADKHTPEFSNRMTYMELNPDWTVPPGIIKRDYLPKLKANPNALGHLQVIDARGRVVPRSAIDFASLSAANFPYNLRQAPGAGNALGRVKFMFPNPHSIYLHDTPDKHLFARDQRTYSSGCVRLNDPFEFAYELLSRQEADPRAAFHKVLDTRRQERLFLAEPVPIHLDYRTAFTTQKGRLQFRKDVYGRDAAIFRALVAAGVETGAADS